MKKISVLVKSFDILLIQDEINERKNLKTIDALVTIEIFKLTRRKLNLLLMVETGDAYKVDKIKKLFRKSIEKYLSGFYKTKIFLCDRFHRGRGSFGKAMISYLGNLCVEISDYNFPGIDFVIKHLIDDFYNPNECCFLKINPDGWEIL
jgi:hypothetical protein